MSLSRRQLLGSVAALAALRHALPRATASTDAPCHLLVVTALGGWDITYTFDPKPGSALVEGPELDEDPDDPDDVNEIHTFSSIPVLVNPVRRPKVTRFFERWADRTLVANGLWVGSIAHEDCRTRVLTGTTTASSADMAAITGAGLGEARPIPYMDLTGAGHVGPLAALSGRTGLSNQLGQLLERQRALKGPDGLRYPQYHPSGDDADAISAWLRTAADRHRAAYGGWGRAPERLDQLAEARRRADTLLSDGRSFADALARATNRTLRSQTDLALNLLTSGLSHTVTLDTGDNWDTHADNVNQHAMFDGLFDGLDHLVSSLDEADLLDRTAILVVSEMARTPRRNSQGGKDHWPLTSALLLGGPFRGGRVIGGTTDGLDARAVDLSTGAPDAAGSVARYDHLAAGVLEAIGVDPEPWLPGVPALRGLA